MDGKQFSIAFVKLVDVSSVEKSEDILREFINSVSKEVEGDYFFTDSVNGVILYPATQKDNIKKIIIEKATLFERDHDVRIKSVLIEKSFKDISDIYGLYPSFVYIEDENLNSHEKIVISEKANGEEEDNEKYNYSLEMEKKIILAVENGAREETFMLLRHVLKNNLEEKKLSMAEFKEFCYAISQTARRIAILCDLGSIYYNDKINERIVSARTKESLWDVLDQFYGTVFENIDVKEKDRQSVLFKKIDRYVVENFRDMDKISAVSVAAKFNVSAGYIYRLYKKMTKKTFISYVLDLRVEEAKRLLRENHQMKIKDVAENVGYSNPTSFMRLFKKATGESPESYRLKSENQQ